MLTNFDKLAEEAADEIWHNRKSLEWENARYTIKAACEKAYALGVNAVLAARATASECEHLYSKSMNQPYPRHCVKCGEIERATASEKEKK